MEDTICRSLGVHPVGLSKRLNKGIALLMLAVPVFAQQVTVDITHSTNSFSPQHALGAAIDRDPLNSVHSNHYFQGTVKQISFGADNYVWHAKGQNGYANPDGPAVSSNQSGGKGVDYVLPKASVAVLRGLVQ